MGMTLPAPTRPTGRGCAPDLAVYCPSIHQKPGLRTNQRSNRRGSEAGSSASLAMNVTSGSSLLPLVGDDVALGKQVTSWLR
jgi:hypothetical protein